MNKDSQKMLEYLKTADLPMPIRVAGMVVFSGCCPDVKIAKAKIAIEDLEARHLVRLNEKREVLEVTE